jgi:hypothetical protein
MANVGVAAGPRRLALVFGAFMSREPSSSSASTTAETSCRNRSTADG